MFSLYPGKSKDRFSRKLDKFFWWFIRLLPIFLMLLIEYASYRSGGGADETLFYYVAKFVDVNDNNVVFNALYEIFGPGRILPFFNGNVDLIHYMSYLVYVELLHLFFDVIIFIPRLARKWINIACQDD